MKLITKCGAWNNGEVAYLAWDVAKPIEDCLGFMITRVHITGADKGKRRILPTWVAFKTQSNPNWNEQDSSVWPIQRFEWRDLTLRKSRDKAKVRPIDFTVKYEIVPVGLNKPGRTLIPASQTAPSTDAAGNPSFTGAKIPLYQIGEPTETNAIDVTHDYGKVSATFTNGILSTQNIVRQLESVGKPLPKKLAKGAISPKKSERVAAAKATEDHLLSVLKKEIVNPASQIRKFLMGDVYDFVTRLIDRAKKEKGQVYLALYELHDPELVAFLVKSMKAGLIHLILCTAGSTDPNPKGTPKANRKPVIWDTENDPARSKLRAAAPQKERLIDRMFNTSSRIGHNKFAVYVDKNQKAVAVMTGSTNWTETGLCAQSNNCIIIENAKLAGDYWDYWKRLQADPQPPRVPVSVGTGKKKISGAKPSAGRQAAALRTADAASPGAHILAANSGSAQLWCSPNTVQASVPKTPNEPPDLKMVYEMMKGAKKAILFLTFLPGLSGKNNIIGVAAALAAQKKDLLVLGAISDPKAMPPPAQSGPTTFTNAQGKVQKIPPPAIWWPEGEQSRIAMIRAAAVRIPFGNFRPELLTAGHAIIHNKIIVIDPLDKDNCAVITGSHNLGFRASYCNDDNMLIVRGNRDLAICYAVHVLDLYDHYVFRARLEEKLRDDLIAGKIKSLTQPATQPNPQGLLATNSTWQDSHFDKNRPLGALDYFL